MTTINDPIVKKEAPNVALVLGAGGAKGFAHIGILQVLHQARIPIDLIVGCSIGALVGAFYADGKEPEEIFETGLKFMPQRTGYSALGLPYFFQGVSGNGFFSTSRLYNVLKKKIKARTFEELQIPLQVTATDIHQGALTVFNQGPLLKSLCASSAIPAFFEAVEIDKKKYVDGGVISELPVYTAQRARPKVIIGSNVKGWIKIEENKDISSIGMRSYYILRHHFDREEESKADIILRPDLSGVMNAVFSDPKTMREVYERGKRTAEAELPRIKALLEKMDLA